MSELTTDELKSQIEAMQEHAMELMAENDKLRQELLKAPNAQMVALVAEWELWLEDEKYECEDYHKRNRSELGSADEWHTMINIGIKFNELKAKHLSTKEQ